MLLHLKRLSKTITVSYGLHPQQKWSPQTTFGYTHLRISWYHNTLQSLYSNHYFHRQQPSEAILTHQADVSIPGDGSFAYNPADRVGGEISHARVKHVTNGRQHLIVYAAGLVMGGKSSSPILLTSSGLNLLTSYSHPSHILGLEPKKKLNRPRCTFKLIGLDISTTSWRGCGRQLRH